MIINIKVIPNAPKTERRGIMADGTLKIAVHAARADGKANEELIRFLAEHFQCSRERVHIVRGATASRKVVEI